MSDNSAPIKGPETLPTRPERRFEGRRKFIGLGVIGILLVFAWFILRAFQNPMGGVGSIGMKPPTATATRVRATITVVSIAAPTVAPTATTLPTVRPGTAMIAANQNPGTNLQSALTCWANEDIALDDKSIVPRDAMLRITGWTAARGGMVELQNLWIAETKVRCNGDPRVYERPFVMVPTRARSNATGGASDAPRIVYVPVTATPGAPIPTPTPINGMYLDGTGCWRLNLEGVREIWINGKGLSNGVYCAVNDIRIVAR